MISPKTLQLVYFSVAVFSSWSTLSNTSLILCAKVVSGMCIADFCFVKKKDMIVHHLMALAMMHSMYHHSMNPYTPQLLSAVLSTEISTVFLTLNNLLENERYAPMKPWIKGAFITTFVYYRLYNYPYYFILNKEIRNSYRVYSANSCIYWETCGSIYGLFLVNVYWTFVIMERVFLGQFYKKYGMKQ